MKKSLLLFALLISSVFVFAQYEEEKEKGFQRNRLFIGSGINVGFSQGWILGLNPEVGYSLTNFLDAGIATNINYITQNFGQGVRYRFFAVGGGPYVRGWILNQFFITSQFEFNRITERLTGTFEPERSIYTAPSLLVGAGWGSRQVGRAQFFTSIMVDVLRNPNSPYIDRQTSTLLPVFRTGFMFYLKP
jgi:hypothetical protein